MTFRTAQRVDEYPILVVEDNDIDFRQLERAFRSLRIANPVYRCVNGDEALDYMFRLEGYEDPLTSPRPSMILLDLNLVPGSERSYRYTGISGKEVLSRIKEHAELRQIPVVIFTTSESPDDVAACYQAGANTYMNKPVDDENFLDAMRRLDQFWLHIAVLPKGDGGSLDRESFVKLEP